MNDLIKSELEEIYKWRKKESDKIIEQLQITGKSLGLDGGLEEFAPIRKEYYRRILAIFDKYNLPNKPDFSRYIKMYEKYLKPTS